jgi:hypothetical protein
VQSIQFIKGGFAFRAGKELGFRAPVWQRGFSEVRIYDSRLLASKRIHPEEGGEARFGREATTISIPPRTADLD